MGSGTKSTYDVGTTGGIGVTRYGGGTGPSMSAYSVPSTGYGSMGGSGDAGSSTVGVTRFSSEGPWENPYGATANEWSKLSAQNKQDIYNGTTDYAHILYPDYYRASGGPISPGSPYWVGEKGPELVVPSGSATVIPHSQSMALATSSQNPADQDKLVAAITDTSTNTKKTAQILDDIKTTGSASGSGLSSGGGSSGGGLSTGGAGGNEQFLQYMAALRTAAANFAAAGIVGGGNIGYGSQGLGATPEQIAFNAVYGGVSAVGSPGANQYENTLAQTAADRVATEARRHKAVYGFAPGGMIGGDSRDTQKVEFFKRPSEKVIIADNDQISDQRSGSSGGGGGQRPIVINQTHNWNGNAPPSKESQAAIRANTAAGIRDALRSVNGR